MAFDNVGKFTLQAGQSMWVWIDLGDRGGQTIRAQPEFGINLRLVTSEQGKVIAASFSHAEYQWDMYSAVIRCERVTWLPSGNPPNPVNEVVTFHLTGGGFV
jgi:hypothetical protein